MNPNPNETDATSGPRWVWGIASLLAVAVVVALYWPARTGALFYDDYNALDAMAKIKTFADMKAFVLGGTAGPLGRPIALASYLPHAADWPHSSVGILTVNIAIHALNAVLLGIFAWALLRLQGIACGRARWIALGAATLWAVMPVVASSSLIVIQRMTTLASTFMLLGLIGFALGYRSRQSRPYRAFALQFGSLGLGTVLGMFTKETAVLTPVYALVVEAVLARTYRFTPGALRTLTPLSLYGALFAILWYLSPLHIDWTADYANRGWSPWARLQYEVVVLWEYLRLALAPLPTAFGPFHDWRDLQDFSPTQSLLAALAWVAAAAAAWWVRRRYENPWPLFALLWFLTGHLLESTTANLELVFEHRNYLAVFGLALALAVGAASAPGHLSRMAPALFLAYIGIQAASLLAMTTLWGDRVTSAQRWAERYPGSARAALHLAFLEIGKLDDLIAGLNAEMIAHERQRYAIQILDRTAGVCPDCVDVRIQTLLFACFTETPAAIEERVSRLQDLLGTRGKINRAVADGFFVIQSVASQGRCGTLNNQRVQDLVRAVMKRPDPVDATLLARILFVGALAAHEEGNDKAAHAFLSEGERVAPTALPILQFQVFLYGQAKNGEAARAVIERRRQVDRRRSLMTDAVLDQILSDFEVPEEKK